jgi:hypothetical protein
MLYGYDDRYAYAWVFCAGYTADEEFKPTMGTASSIPTRLEYTGSDYEIVSFEQPKDGSLYTPTLQKLFPKKVFALTSPSNEDVEVLEAKVFLRAQAYAAPISASSFAGSLSGKDVFEQIAFRITDIPALGRKATLRIGDSVVVVPGNNPQGLKVVDLDTRDDMQEIAVSDAGPSGDPTTNFYSYDGKDILFIGMTQGMDDEIVYDGMGGLSTTTRGQILDTWFYLDDYKLQANRTLARVPKEFYERISPDWPVTVLAPITLQKSATDRDAAITLQMGDVVMIVGCDDIEWCKVENARGVSGWFAVENFNTIKGYGEAGTIFEGLSNAD